MDFKNNLLKQALQIIPPSAFYLQKFTGNTVNELGNDVSSYAEPVKLTGSVQAVDSATYQELGLDFNKNYKTFFAGSIMQSLGRNGQESPDRLIYQGKVYEVVNANDWYAYNGWTYVIGVEVGNA